MLTYANLGYVGPFENVYVCKKIQFFLKYLGKHYIFYFSTFEFLHLFMAQKYMYLTDVVCWDLHICCTKFPHVPDWVPSISPSSDWGWGAISVTSEVKIEVSTVVLVKKHQKKMIFFENFKNGKIQCLILKTGIFFGFEG